MTFSASRRLGPDPLFRTACSQFRGIDAAQPHLGGDFDAGPHMHARLERVAVEHAQHIGRLPGPHPVGGGHDEAGGIGHDRRAGEDGVDQPAGEYPQR